MVNSQSMRVIMLDNRCSKDRLMLDEMVDAIMKRSNVRSEQREIIQISNELTPLKVSFEIVFK